MEEEGRVFAAVPLPLIGDDVGTAGDSPSSNNIGPQRIHNNNINYNCKRKSSQLTEKPKHPLTAYNLFFRSRLDHLTQTKNGTSIAKQNQVGGTKVHFAELAQTVAAEWKQLDASTKAMFDQRAQLEKFRYICALEQWNKKQANHAYQSTLLAEEEAAATAVAIFETTMMMDQTLPMYTPLSESTEKPCATAMNEGLVASSHSPVTPTVNFPCTGRMMAASGINDIRFYGGATPRQRTHDNNRRLTPHDMSKMTRSNPPVQLSLPNRRPLQCDATAWSYGTTCHGHETTTTCYHDDTERSQQQYDVVQNEESYYYNTASSASASSASAAAASSSFCNGSAPPILVSPLGDTVRRTVTHNDHNPNDFYSELQPVFSVDHRNSTESDSIECNVVRRIVSQSTSHDVSTELSGHEVDDMIEETPQCA